MSMNAPLNCLGSFWYQSEPSDVPNQFLDWDFFAVSYSKTALVSVVSTIIQGNGKLTKYLLEDKSSMCT